MPSAGDAARDAVVGAARFGVADVLQEAADFRARDVLRAVCAERSKKRLGFEGLRGPSLE